MPKERRSKRKKTQHDKFVELARASGADESEASFVAKVRAISSTKPRKKKSRVAEGTKKVNPKFREAVDSLHPAFERLIAAPPHMNGAKLPKQGVYLFFENGKAIYAGRSNTIPQRFGQHTRPGSQTNQAALATLIARKELGLPVDYRKGARARLLANREFMIAFERAKTRVRAMEFRAVEEPDQKRQALLEIYCAITLETPFNDFGTH